MPDISIAMAQDGKVTSKIRFILIILSSYPASSRLWRYTGTEVPDSASASAGLFVLGAIAVLTGVLAELRSAAVAVVMGLVLLGTPFFMQYGVAQSADVPLSMFVLNTIALISVHRLRAPDRPGLMVLAGFTAGCAGWVKNEGLLFLLIAGFVVLLPILNQPVPTLRRFAAFAAGASMPLCVIAWFKIAIATPSDIVGNRHYAEVVEKIWTAERHDIILHMFWNTLWSFGDWLVNPIIWIMMYVVITGIDGKMVRDFGWLQGALMCVFLAIGYYAVYLTTPMDLRWHLGSSLPRLYLQIWPSALLLTGLLIVPH